MVLPIQRGRDAVDLARTFAAAVRKLPNPGQVAVGVSIGVVNVERGERPSRGELLRCADLAMYRAKRARTVVHQYVREESDGHGQKLSDPDRHLVGKRRSTVGASTG